MSTAASAPDLSQVSVSRRASLPLAPVELTIEGALAASKQFDIESITNDDKRLVKRARKEAAEDTKGTPNSALAASSLFQAWEMHLNPEAFMVIAIFLGLKNPVDWVVSLLTYRHKKFAKISAAAVEGMFLEFRMFRWRIVQKLTPQIIHLVAHQCFVRYDQENPCPLADHTHKLFNWTRLREVYDQSLEEMNFIYIHKMPKKWTSDYASWLVETEDQPHRKRSSETSDILRRKIEGDFDIAQFCPVLEISKELAKRQEKYLDGLEYHGVSEDDTTLIESGYRKIATEALRELEKRFKETLSRHGDPDYANTNTTSLLASDSSTESESSTDSQGVSAGPASGNEREKQVRDLAIAEQVTKDLEEARRETHFKSNPDAARVVAADLAKVRLEMEQEKEKLNRGKKKDKGKAP